MAHHKCAHCGKPVILSPSAAARAKKYGETPEYYRRLFPSHTECVLRARQDDLSKLLARVHAKHIAGGAVILSNGHKQYSGGGSK